MRFFLSIVLTLLILTACKTTHNTKSSKNGAPEKVVLDDVIVRASNSYKSTLVQPPLRPMVTRTIDLVHTTLHLSFNLEKQWVLGKAVLRIRPYARPLNRFQLDAHTFQLNRIAWIKAKDTVALNYAYDSSKLTVNLPEWVQPTDTFTLFIDYIAKPNEIPGAGGRAITDNKGLYFVDPLQRDPFKPTQIWSQGEPECNSGWFPTVDLPGEKHTQDIYLTVPTDQTTLSNGLLVGSASHQNGTKTDHWQQKKPHAPYLTMIAIGNFQVTKDSWRNKEVSYYLEPDYHPYARLIFGTTTQMLEVFSQRLGVEYPWEKFSQVVARDYVSGAMENTSAVLHGEFVQHDSRAHLDNTQEDVIAHELFHHWFGDYVTARTWSCLPLNESFATYGEYIWHEAKFGKAYADYYFTNNLNAYLRSKNKYNTCPYREHYQEPDEVFDVVSYQKGSRIIHYLRRYLGDEVFFKGLNRYLTQNAYGIADFHDLRKAFETESGEDLNWYFNEWFFGIGHPELNTTYSYDAAHQMLQVTLRQVQDSAFGVFKLPLKLAVRWGTGKDQMVQHALTLTKKEQVFQFECPVNPMLVVLDPEAVLPGKITESKTAAQWLNQYVYATEMGEKMKAINEIRKLNPDTFPEYNQLTKLLLENEPFPLVTYAFGFLQAHAKQIQEFKAQLLKRTEPNENTRVRAEAMRCLTNFGKEMIPINIAALNDSSYLVQATALTQLKVLNPDTAFYFAGKLEKVHSGEVQDVVADIYTERHLPNKHAFFESIIGRPGPYKTFLLSDYRDYLLQAEPNDIEEGIGVLQKYFTTNTDRDMPRRMEAICLKLKAKLEELQKANANQDAVVQAQKALTSFQAEVALRLK